MPHLSRFRYFLIAGMLFGLLLAGQAARAQDDRSLHWERWDTTIDNVVTRDNRFDVTEVYVIVVDQGPFRFGTRNIPLNRITQVDGLQVSEDGTPLTLNCNGGAGTFCAQVANGEYRIRYEFRSQAESSDQRTFRIKYTVHGALRSYPGGDQIWWTALTPKRTFPVTDATVTVKLPADLVPQIAASNPSSWKQTQNGSTYVWYAPGNLGKDGNIEVRIQYPHDARMVAPAWQTEFDRGRSTEDVLSTLLPLGCTGLGVLLAIVGPILAYTQYARKGRDPEAVVVPEYLTEPPSDVLPGVVGTLIDEKADMQDIMATLVDLARRGYMVIEQTKGSGLGGILGGTEFTLHYTGKADEGLHGAEKLLLDGIFDDSGNQVALSELRDKFYTHIPGIKQELYNELVKAGYFARSPETTRRRWIALSVGIFVLAGLVGFAAYSLLSSISSLVILPAIGLGITGVAFLLIANHMPAKTPKGAQEIANWRAFRQYLSNIQKYTDLQQASDQFERYMAYAVAFGIDKQWLHDFAPVLTSMPTWYYPTYLGGPWDHGYQGGSLTDFGGPSIGGFGGLNGMSQSLTEGLNAMSNGLTQMLNDASSAMTSQPSSSGSDSGGWSGGGDSGGGSSGGGSADFG